MRRADVRGLQRRQGNRLVDFLHMLSLARVSRSCIPGPAWASVIAIITGAMVFGLYCRALGVHACFFRAESGLFLRTVFAPADSQWHAVRTFFVAPYNGHYLPLALSAEFLQARLIGTCEPAWFWRQMIILGGLATASGWLLHQTARNYWRAGPLKSAAAIAGGGFFLFQPYVIEMATWPFMSLQFVALTLMASSAVMLKRFANKPSVRSFAAFVLLSYACMHFTGVGAAISVAAIVTGTVLLIVSWRTQLLTPASVRHAAVILMLVSCLTVAHGAAMASGMNVIEVGSPQVSWFLHVVRFGALVMGSVYGSVRAMWASGGFPWPRVDVQETESIYGIGTIAWIGVLAGGALHHFAKTRERQSLCFFASICYPCLCILVYAGLIALRLRNEASPDAITPYLIGGRYIIFPSYCIVMVAMAAWPLTFPLLGRTALVLPIVVTATAACGTAVFALTEMPRLWPHSQINHGHEWTAILADVSAAATDSRPVLNRSLTPLTVEFAADLRDFMPLLKHDLGDTLPILIEDPKAE